MIVDLATYEVNRLVVETYILKHTNDVGRAISMMAATTSVPVIVIAYWAGELLDWPESIIDQIKGLVAFYGYSEIKNKPKNAPI